MHSRRLLTLGPDNEPLWVRLYIQRVGEQWAATIVADKKTRPEPGNLKGMAFFGETPEHVEWLALTYLGEGVSQN